MHDSDPYDFPLIFDPKEVEFIGIRMAKPQLEQRMRIVPETGEQVRRIGGFMDLLDGQLWVVPCHGSTARERAAMLGLASEIFTAPRREPLWTLRIYSTGPGYTVSVVVPTDDDPMLGTAAMALALEAVAA